MAVGEVGVAGTTVAVGNVVTVAGSGVGETAVCASGVQAAKEMKRKRQIRTVRRAYRVGHI
jgi:hypothetical protein